MSGSKTTSDDEQHHFSSSSGSGQYHHHANTTSSPTKRQQNLLQETAAVPFSSPAISPIPKHNDDDENDLHDFVGAYPSEIAGSSNDDSEPYLLSSMSEEDHLKLGAAGSTTAVPQDNATTTSGVEKSTPLHMEFELKPSTSSEENKFSSNNSREAHQHQQHQQPQQNVVPVNNFKKKELRCVTDVQILTTSVGMSGSFSPMGNNSVATNGSMDTPPTGNRFQLPKFYDSEEEGVGSLVLVPSSKSLSSPRMMQVGGQGGPSPTSSSFAAAAAAGGVGGGPAPPPQFPLPKDHRHGLTTTPAHLLPYQQRKKLIVEQVPNTPTSTTDKRPPVPPSSSTKPPPPSSSFAGAAVVGGNVMVVASEPPPTVSGAELAKKYGGVAEIPPFKRAGDNTTTNDVEGTTTMTPMKKSKSADSSNKPIPTPPPPPTTFSSPVNNNNKNDTTEDKREEKKTENDTSSKQTPRPIPVLQEVICPSQPQSPSMRSSSPSGEGSYHIRVSSCGSISSLGSMAVDSDSIRHAPRRDHPNHNGGQQQQQQQQQQYYQQMQPPPYHYYGGYPQQPQPPMRGPPNGGGGFVDLSQDIALYLHGEQIANAGGEAPPHHGHGEYPPQNYWNQQQHDPSQYGYGGGGQQQHPYQQQQQHYPPPLPQAEPIPPPLTQVPNMQMGHRSRLPSISDDDWSEDIEKYKADMDGRDDGNRAGGGGRNGNNNNQQQQPYPLPPQRSYNYGRDRMAYPHQLPPPAQNRQRDQRKRKENHPQQQQQHPENRPNERSSLLGPNNRNYDEYGGWNGGGGNNNNPNPTYYKTPPRRGNKKNPQETKSTKRKKSKRRRDRRSEKEKLRNLYSTDSSPEEDEKHRRSVRSSRRKKRHGGRKRRDDDVSDTMSETYSESFMSASLTDRLKSAETNVNFFQRMMIRTKLLICNLPLSAAAISFSIVLLGIVWLRRAEEILTSCKEVNFHSSQCNFPEFPGCYFCDTFDHWYQVATKFHTICSYVGGLSVALYAAKAMLFGRVFIDEMSSPTTASPAGLIFMTMALAFTGKGAAGAVAVFVASFLHLALLLWFIYMSLAYQTMPDPSWFPNTIGIGLCAVKVWFYNPLCGHFLIAMTLMLTFLYYPIR
eukprot:scaffold1439_cov118-Skeletonema_dohrnii-CCMP3373.AAC.6